MPTLGLVHNSPMLAGVFNEIAARVMPDVRILHFVDESTIKNTIAAGHLQKSTMRQVIRLVGSTFDAGCDVAMVTCSSIGRAVEMAAELYDQPVLRVDRAMAEQAVASATRIGVVATLSTTLDPTADLVRRVAAEQGKAIELVAHLCEGAFDQRGDSRGGNANGWHVRRRLHLERGTVGAVCEAEFRNRFLDAHVSAPEEPARERVASHEQQMENEDRQPEVVMVYRAA